MPDFLQFLFYYSRGTHHMSQNDQPIKPWGGRFTEATDAFVERFTASIGFDYRLYHHDINGSIAHATMLAKVVVLTEAERDQIIAGQHRLRVAKIG